MRIQGVLLFLFIPLVLFLFLKQPIGPGWSVALGLAIMVGHRLVAAPWAAKFADVRCLWCGRDGIGRTVPVFASGRQWRMNACSDTHAALISRFLGTIFRFRVPLAIGIFVPLAWLILASLLSAAGRPLLSHATSALVFRVAVALTVVTASLAPFADPTFFRRSPSSVLPSPFSVGRSPLDQPLRCPFPIHNLSLLGIGNTLWVFRLVGAWWLIDALVRLKNP
jgi:hypothetical protein